MSLSRIETDLLGSVASPFTIGTSSSNTATLDLTSVAGTFEAAVAVMVNIGGSPTVAPTVQFYFSLDGANYYADGGAVVVPTGASTANAVGPYVPPAAARKARAQVFNNDASVTFTTYVQGTVLASSAL